MQVGVRKLESRMVTVAIVAQEAEVFEFLGYVLTKEGYNVRLFRDPKVVATKLQALAPKVILIECGGFITNVEATCSRIRSWENFDSVRILVVAPESRSTVGSDKYVGADAVLFRPLHPRIVLAQVKKLLRGKPMNQPLRELAVADLLLDPSCCRVSRSGRLVPLGVREFRLLYFLASHPGMTWDREELIGAVWPDAHLAPDVVDVLVRRLRNRIEENPKKPTLIRGTWADGYCFQISAATSPVTTTEATSASNGPRDNGAVHRSGDNILKKLNSD